MIKEIINVVHGTFTQLRSLVMIFGHAFRKRDTLQYPEEPVYLPPRYRGRIVLTRDPDGEERCVACNLCAVACPVGCISLQKAETEDGRWYPEFFRINFSRCIFCGLCEEACPTTAIQLTPDFEMGEFKRQDLVYEARPADLRAGQEPGLQLLPRCGDGDRRQAERRRAERSRTDQREKPAAIRRRRVEFAFYFAAGVAVLATLRVITNSNPVHALLYLIISLLAISMTFFSLGAPFAGALEIIVYAGAIMVLFVFVVMMLNLGPAVVEQERKWLTPGIWVGPSALALVLLVELLVVLARTPSGAGIGHTTVDAKAVGISLYGPYLLVVELASMLLLAALVAAYHLGRQDAKQ